MSAVALRTQLLAILLVSSVVTGYPSGAPSSTCWTRYPKHKGIGTQTTACPIHITFSPTNYTPGAEILVTIEDPNPIKRWFSGIQLGAFRDSGNQEEIVGQFVGLPTDKIKALTCLGGYKNMITHKNRLKVQKLQVTWKAPNENVGNLTFKATIVANFETFWTTVEAKLPSLVQDAAYIKPPQHQGITTRNLVQDVSFTSCGNNKGCFVYPSNCWDTDNCLAGVSFEHRPGSNDFLFEMYSTAEENWVAVGFSHDIIMGHDETISCVSNGGHISIQHGWNPGYHNERLLTRFISQPEVKNSDGKLQCRFVLPTETSAYIINQESSALNYTNVTFNRDQDWYLMLAWGKAMPLSDVLSKHREIPATTFRKINLKDNEIYKGSSFPVLVRVHGALMMIAWIFFGGIVTVISRHYRDWLPQVRLFGTKVWFQVHRELAILIVVLTALGFIVIFSQYGAEIRKFSVPHSYVGLTVVAAMSLQVTAGFLRPGPDHKIRFLFNWGHRVLGQITHILSAVTMFLAYDIVYFNKEMKTFGIAVLSVWVIVQLLMHIAYEILTCKVLVASSGSSVLYLDSMPLGDKQTDTDAGTEEKKLNYHTVFLGVYVVILAGLCSAALLAFLLF